MKIPSEVLWARTLGMCLSHDKLWYSPMAFNGLFCADIYTGKTGLISEFNAFDEKFNGLKFSYVLPIGEYLYFCPYEADCICEFSLIDRNMKFYHSDYISAPHVSNAICIQDKLYMFCNKQLQIIVFDIATKEISAIKNVYFIERFAKGSYVKKDVAYNDASFFIADEQKIIKLNIPSQEVCDYDLSQYTAGKPVTTISFDGERFWIMCGDSEILGWNEKEGAMLSYRMPKLGQAVHSIINGENLYIFFADINKVLIFNLIDRQTSIVEVDQGYCYERGEKVFFYPFIDNDNKKGIYIYTFIGHKVVYLEAGGDVSYTELYIDQDDTIFKEIYISYLQNIFYPVKGVLHEQKDLFYYSLESYAKGVISGMKSNEGLKDNVGEKVYYSL